MKISTLILLIRHAEYDTTLNPNDLLSVQGRENAEKLAQWLKQNYQLDALYASTLTRARETTEIINKQFLLPIEFKDELQEYNVWPLLPKFSGFFDAKDAFGWQHQQTLSAEYWMFAERVFTIFREIINTHQGKTMAIVAHGHVIGTLIRSLIGGHRMTIHSEPTGVTQLQHWDDGTWEIDFLNRREHLL